MGLNCVCNGLVVGNFCDICYNLPHTTWLNGSCHCNDGYYLSAGICLPYSSNSNTNLICQPGNIYDPIKKLCKLCSNGCLSCLLTGECQQCRPEYNFLHS